MLQLFENFVREKKEELRKGGKSRLQLKKNAFRHLMEEVNLHFKLVSYTRSPSGRNMLCLVARVCSVEGLCDVCADGHTLIRI